MGLSHQAIIGSHPDVDLVAVCDTTEYLLDVIKRYTPVKTYTDYREMIASEKLDAVFVATPSRFHPQMVRAALDANLHVFCEKPFCLDVEEGARLAELAESKKRVNQVGYHYRFVGAFHEMKRLLDLGVIGKPHHIRAEAYGPVVLRPKGSTWRTSRTEGGGCLFDYATHAIDLLNFMVGRPQSVSGTVMNPVFSNDVEDEVYASFFYPDGITGQLIANWSDDSHRKMSTKISIWGRNGRLVADRQELQIYVRDNSAFPQFNTGWNTRYTTDLTEQVWYYLRGEEYSAQVDHFIQAIKNGQTATRSTFRSAVDADLVTQAMTQDSNKLGTAVGIKTPGEPKESKANFWDILRRAKPAQARS